MNHKNTFIQVPNLQYINLIKILCTYPHNTIVIYSQCRVYLHQLLFYIIILDIYIIINYNSLIMYSISIIERNHADQLLVTIGASDPHTCMIKLCMGGRGEGGGIEQ